ncbi:hypothetical protein AGABI1DRAFT_109562 [Agaricus bisporus var. burnettii JB137-S8]|uniref:G-protein coupled receptors family 1 profile domain-containing protein n=1 Tax=Agaricus bisporus var. burnettii (strain JB137-S8 / ATCC MYA-4627 / FGSC 10392) TaxID=597362 RepID=K5VLL0_AGABU|nr:uncharacterized protein AGABI1DRAFT_109562 [Agaricus bisporus var. burnettii JB137-S8]EKM75289.1 hypothetical protein AGABI1DRAFT_109562 [Agaricus bisporus var. burnettii JB137-S8]
MSDNIPSNLNIALSLITSTTVVAVLYTFSLILYCLCARLSYFWLRGLDGKRPTVLTFTLATVISICATIDVALSNQYARLTFVDYAFLPGGPLGLSAQAHASTIIQILSPAILIAGILTLGVLLWRVWVVYSETRFSIPIIVIALSLYLAYVVLIWAPLAAALPNITRILDVVAVASLGFTIACKITLTFMIILRLMLIRQKHIKLMGKTDVAAQYLGIAAMVIESYALSTVWNICYLVAYILKDPPTHNFFENTTTQVEVLTYFLVLYRVLSGRAWNRQTQNQLSTLRWGRHITQLSEADSDMGVGNNHMSNVLGANPPVLRPRPTAY